MNTEQRSLTPLHLVLAGLEAWRIDPSAANVDEVRAGLEALLGVYESRGAYLIVHGAPLADLSLGVGSLAGHSPPDAERRLARSNLVPAGAPDDAATLWLDGPAEALGPLSNAIELAVGSVWSKQEALSQRQQLDALDGAVRSIASLLPVERVLQLIVDRVRELVAAQYAALGIIGPFGRIESFMTSGMTPEQRLEIGALPSGHGLLGLIIREDSSFLIDDIAVDPRRHGFPEHHPEMHSFIGVPVRSKGHSIGNLYVTNKLIGRPFTQADLNLVEKFALHAGVAIENARLHEEIQRLAIVEERERISQDLHDSVIQSLYAISLSLEDLPDIISEDAVEGALRADRAIDAIHATIRDIRNFIMGLQPELEETDLAAGIESLAAEFQSNTLIDLELRLGTDLPQLPREHAGHLLSMIREGLSNIARHSGSTRASLELANHDGTLLLIIGDNGRGFDPAQPRSARQHGLANLRSRAEAVGGILTLTSEVGAGTRLEAKHTHNRKRRPMTSEKTPDFQHRLLVVDDHEVVRQGLVAMLSRRPGFQVVAEAGTAAEAVDMARRYPARPGDHGRAPARRLGHRGLPRDPCRAARDAGGHPDQLPRRRGRLLGHRRRRQRLPAQAGSRPRPGGGARGGRSGRVAARPGGDREGPRARAPHRHRRRDGRAGPVDGTGAEDPAAGGRGQDQQGDRDRRVPVRQDGQELRQLDPVQAEPAASRSGRGLPRQTAWGQQLTVHG